MWWSQTTNKGSHPPCKTYVEKVLVPTLHPGDIAIMDNLGSHKGKAVRQLIRAPGAKLFFLPKYPPDLNPIEQVFAKLKHLLRKAAARSVGCAMGQVLHGCATTTEAIRRTIQNSQESLRALSKRYGINPKTVAKWKQRGSVTDLPTGPKEPKSTSLSLEDEAIIVAFRQHTLLPLDDCLYALQATIPHLTRSSLHRCLQRHGISRLPDVEDGKGIRRKFKNYPIGYFHIDIAEVRTAMGRLYLFVAIDRTSKFAFTELHEKATRSVAADFLRNLIKAVPYKVHTVLTDNGTHFTDPSGESWTRGRYQSHDRAKGTILGSCLRHGLRPQRYRSSPD